MRSYTGLQICFDNTCIGTLLIALMQKHCREGKQLNEGNIRYLTMGFAVYQTAGYESKQLDTLFFMTQEPVVVAEYYESREACGLYKLPTGEYCIIPYTWEPADGEFLLRIYSEKPLQ